MALSSVSSPRWIRRNVRRTTNVWIPISTASVQKVRRSCTVSMRELWRADVEWQCGETVDSWQKLARWTRTSEASRLLYVCTGHPTSRPRWKSVSSSATVGDGCNSTKTSPAGLLTSTNG